MRVDTLIKKAASLITSEKEAPGVSLDGTTRVERHYKGKCKGLTVTLEMVTARKSTGTERFEYALRTDVPLDHALEIKTVKEVAALLGIDTDTK